MSASILLRDLIFAYPGREPLWPPLMGSLPCARYGLVGNNGAGKSTLLRLIDGTLKPESGTVEKRGEWLLLDEPTAHLKRAQRLALYRRIARWPGGVLVASHDADLLERLEQIVEIGDRGLRRYGGPYAFYQAQRRTEDAAAARTTVATTGELEREKCELAKTRERALHAAGAARRRALRTNVPKLVRNAGKRKAQQSAGKQSRSALRRIAAAQERLAAAHAALRTERQISIDLQHTAVPRARPIASCTVAGVTIEIVGPRRIGVIGPNARWAIGALAGSARVPVALLDAGEAFLDDRQTLAEAMRDAAPQLREHERRAILGRLLFEQKQGISPIGTLSGGERVRAALALLLWRSPPPGMLLLDDPTASLDAASKRHLADVLCNFSGALVLSAHDVNFLDALHLESIVEC